MTPEQREAFNAYHREYSKQNKERVKQWRIQSYVHTLEKLGYKVTPPCIDLEQTAKDGDAE